MDFNKLNELAVKKEEELREVKSLQLATLNKDLEETKKFLKLERARFQTLKQDFEYNLKIIEQRDQELLSYEKSFDDLKKLDVTRSSEISDLKIKTEELNNKVEALEREKNELELYYRKRANDMHTQMNKCFSEKTLQIQHEKDEYLKFKKNSERRIKEAQIEMDVQKRQMMFEFEEQMRKKDNELKEKLDELNNLVHCKDLDIKLFKKEQELLREGSNKSTEEKSELSKEIDNLRKQLKKKDWDIKDIENMAEIKSTELKKCVDDLKNEKENMNDEFKIIYANLDKALKSKEQQLNSLQEATEEKERLLQIEIEDLKGQILKSENSVKQKIWDFNDRIKERDLKIENMKEMISEYERKAKIGQEKLAQAVVSRDLEIETLKSAKDNLEEHLKVLHVDFKKSRKESELLKERENLLIQTKQQLELEWQKRYDEASFLAEEKYKNVISSLKERLANLSKEMGQNKIEIEQRANLIRMLKKDKDIACNILQNNGIKFDGSLGGYHELVPKDEFDSCLKQKEQLKSVISMMRKEIETLEERHKNELSQSSFQYAKDLEEEVRYLKIDKRNLQNSVDDLNVQLVQARRQRRVSFYEANSKESLIAKGSTTALHAKLQSAAKKIEELVIERDQLLNLGNKLRSELSVLKMQGSVKRQKSSDTNQVQAMFSKKDEDGLDEFENLHYKMMMKKMRDKPKEEVKDIEVDIGSSSESLTLNGNYSRSVRIDEDVPVKDDTLLSMDDKRTMTQSQSFEPINLIQQDKKPKFAVNVTSSSEMSSIQDLWKILEEAESLASQTPRRVSLQGPTTPQKKVPGHSLEGASQSIGGVAEIEGQKLMLNVKEPSKDLQLSKKAQGKVHQVKKKEKVRNYNVKDD